MAKWNNSFIEMSINTFKEMGSFWKNFTNIFAVNSNKVHPDLPDEDIQYLKKQIDDCILEKGGEISNKTRLMELGVIYQNLSETGKLVFFKILAEHFDTDKFELEKNINNYLKSESEEVRVKNELILKKSLISKRVKVFKQFRRLQNGFQFLIDMRVDLLMLSNKDPFHKKLDDDIKYALTTGFDISLLDLKVINWDSSADLLEKLIQYEAVHEIKSWKDLKKRLDSSDRQCYGFFHHKMVNVPLIFIEVAFVKKLSTNIQALLYENSNRYRADDTDTAIFYSISNTQKGLAGIPFGNFLIKRVVEELLKEHKNLKHFATFSPVPGFMKWLDKLLTHKNSINMFSEKEQVNIKKTSKCTDVATGLKTILETNKNWFQDNDLQAGLKIPLMRLCSFYLVKEKKGKRALDPVANFHMTNGAYLKQINWMADNSEKGIGQSAGIMVNYYYDLDNIAQSHELYISEGKIKISKDIKTWLQKFE